jgi:hypothetical protein
LTSLLKEFVMADGTVPLEMRRRSFPFEKGGSAIGVHITDKCRGSRGDPVSLDLRPGNSQSFIWEAALKPFSVQAVCRQARARLVFLFLRNKTGAIAVRLQWHIRFPAGGPIKLNALLGLQLGPRPIGSWQSATIETVALGIPPTRSVTI